MMLDAVKVVLILFCLQICCLKCDTDIENNDGDKFSQASEKDSKIPNQQESKDAQVSVDNQGINVKKQVPVDRVNDNIDVHKVNDNQGTNSKHEAVVDSINDKPSHIDKQQDPVINENIIQGIYAQQEVPDYQMNDGEVVNDKKLSDIDEANPEYVASSPNNDKLPDSSDSVASNLEPQLEDNKPGYSENVINNKQFEQNINKDIDVDAVPVTVFEATGNADESLVEQMKKLSEKIKQINNNISDKKHDHLDKRSVDNPPEEHVIEISGHKETDMVQEQTEQIDIKHDQMFANTEQKTDFENGNDRVEGLGKESVLDQMKEIQKKVKEGSIKIPSLVPSYNNDDLPTDEELKKHDVVSESVTKKDETLEPSSDITIDNTLPPSISTLLLTTVDQNAMLKGSPIQETIEVKATPSLDNVKSTAHSVSELLVIEQIESTRKSEVEHTEAIRKQVLKAEEIKRMRIERHRNAAATGITLEPTTTLQEVYATVVQVEHAEKNGKDTDTEDTTIEDVENLRFSATRKIGHDTGVEQLESSEDKVSGTMYETETLKEPVKMDKSVEHGQEKMETYAPTLAQSNTVHPPLTVSETQSPSDQQSQQQSSSSSSFEETSEEIEKKAQAQRYFEEGEKLINNSYKKDHIQAYEYFKLAGDLGHSKALEYLGFGYLLGDYVTQDPAKALKIFQDLSDKGSPKGQLGLGFSYSAGLAVNSSQAKALIYFTFAALGGDPLAQMVLGYRYLSGIGVESKCETALTYYRKVATTVAENTSSGSPVVQRIRLHEQAENKDNGASSLMDDDLLQYYEFLADKGDVQAQVVLGQLYYQGGRGVPVNHERAQHYFLMAAESGNNNAQAFLGKMHSEGSPVVTQDNDIAYQFFKKAADKGNPIGQCGLGIMHLYGKGVDKDYQKALKFFTQSADQGWSDAQLHLGIMHFGGKGVRRDYKMAVKYFNLASQGGHVLAFYHLAQMHATGTGVLRNCHTAVELYKNVAERGHWSSMLMDAHDLYKSGSVNEALLKYTFLAELGYEVAQTNVAYILDNGESTLFDQKETYQRALLHWTRAASQGSTVARLKMGDYHYYGYGTEIDYESAATHYRLATEQQHNAQAMFNLGYMHENGLGLKQDVHLAKRFYDMAAETSGDAYIPVTLALFKLGVFYGTEVFNKEIETYYMFLNRLDIRYQLGPYWDIYFATFLAIVLGIIIVLHRFQR